MADGVLMGLKTKEIPTAEMEKAIGNLYGLKANSAELMAGGIESAAWLIETDQGKWYAKIYGVHEGPLDWIEEEVELYEHLRAHGVNAPQVRESKNSKKVEEFESTQGKHGLVLMKDEESIQERPAEVSKEQVVKAGEMIAKMHLATKDYPKRDEYETNKLAVERMPKDTYAIFAESANAERHSEERLSEVRNLCERMEEMLRAPLPEDLSKSILHGDLAFEHVRTLPNGEIYIFDFADRWYGPCIADIAVMIENLYRPEDISFDRFEELRGWLMEGYQVVNPLSDRELDLINYCIVRRSLSAINYLSRIAKAQGSEADIDGIRRRWELSEYLMG